MTANKPEQSCEEWEEWRKMAGNYAEMWPEREDGERDKGEGREEDYQFN